MGGSLGLSALALIMGFVVADRVSACAAYCVSVSASVPRLSYGGVLRHCAPYGGAVLILTLCFGLGLFTLLGFVPSAWFYAAIIASAVVIMGSCFPGVVCVAGLRVGAFTGFFILPFSLWLSFAVLIILLFYLVSFTQEADLVPGVPAALFTPIWLAAGSLLIVVHHNAIGLISLVMAGALWAVQMRHRFPPRWVLGPIGCVMIAGFTLVIAAALFHHGQVWALLILSPYFLADGVCSLRRGAPAFEQARLRGEPERGLASASLALSCAHLVVLWTLHEQVLVMQALALSVSFILSLHFRLFLVKRPAHAPLRPPWIEIHTGLK